MTMTGVAMGTFGYMSPEQLAGEDVDQRTDVYAIGVIALETLTGRLGTEGLGFHRTIETELHTRLTAAAVTAPQRRVASAIGRALAPNRAARYASIADMRADLVPAIRECPVMPLSGTDQRTAARGVATAALTRDIGTSDGVTTTDAPTGPPADPDR